ncbi:hypothetical protein GCK32_016947 [Trichostrongylus colubriformis]|uniref:Uncharacterized protein n=1 Tax=Trichostrongylus colubriformis TaxID=6319 RepID=A0AAN8I9F1_TRICO
MRKNKSCAICQKVVGDSRLRFGYSSKMYNMIMLMAHSLAGQVESSAALAIVNSISNKRSHRICHLHVVRAAQYLLAEMAKAGKTVSHFDDPHASGSTAYVTDVDIPRDLLSTLNTMAEGVVNITYREIRNFLNGALKRYYLSTLWTTNGDDVDEDGGEQEIIPETEEEYLKATISQYEMHAEDLLCDVSEDQTCTSTLESSLQKADPAALSSYFTIKEEL